MTYPAPDYRPTPVQVVYTTSQNTLGGVDPGEFAEALYDLLAAAFPAVRCRVEITRYGATGVSIDYRGGEAPHPSDEALVVRLAEVAFQWCLAD